MEEIGGLDEFRQLVLEHLWIPLRTWDVMIGPDGFSIFVKGKGCELTDIEGKTYLDYYSGLGNVTNLGYSRKEIVDAACEQMMQLPFKPMHEPNIPQIKLAKKLADLAPGDLSRVFFANSGTEANETAMKIARKYQQLAGFPHKYKIIVGGYRYHGSTYGSMSLGWNRRVYTWEDYETFLPGTIHVPSPPCFRCDLGLKYPECELRCVKEIERVIYCESPETIAALFDVPISSEYATPPPPEYWSTVESICKKYGVLLIFDEVMTAFGRTGKWFACEHWDIRPDIITVSKSIANGYIPLGATIVSKEVASKFEGGYEEMLKHSYTFEGHPVACAAALATLDIIEKEKLLARSQSMGEYLLDCLKSLRSHRIVGEIGGGPGLNCLVEFVKNPKTGERFSPQENKQFVSVLKEKIRQSGLWGAVSNPLLFRPALIITKDEIEEMVRRLDRTISEIESV